jgi:hypothetical protein
MPNHITKPKTLQLFDRLNRSSDEITSSFFLKKNYPIRKKSLLILIEIEKKAKNTEGPLRSILKDMLVDERMKLPLRFS